MAYNIEANESQKLHDAIGVLEAASKTPARSRTTKIGSVVDEICEHVYLFGLPSTELHQLIALVTAKTELDQGNATSLIKNLYPSSLVSVNIVTRVVSSLGHAKLKPPTSTQAALVRWLTAVHDVLEDTMILSGLYSVLFNLLDMISLRPGLCQLLSYVTRRKHVRPYRIQRLLELAQQTGGEPALLNLLRVYKNFCPDIIIGTTSANIPQSTLPDAEWRQRLQTIQQRSARPAGGQGHPSGFRAVRERAADSAASAIPILHTHHASERAKTLEEIQDVVEFAEFLEVFEAPSQIASAIRDPLLQKYLQLGGFEESERRLEFWLSSYLEDELENVREGFGLSATLSELLSGVVSFSESTKALPTVTEHFLRIYLPLWNGVSDVGTMLDLLAFLPPQPFQELHRSMLSTLEASIFGVAEAPFDILFDFYGCLAQRWMSTAQKANNATHATNAIFELIEHVSRLAESALVSSHNLHSAILRFYERLTDLVTVHIAIKKQLIPSILPPRSLTYVILTTTSLENFSRLCALLVTYKRCFEKQGAGVSKSYQANATDLLNGYLLDVCNMIWRSRALNTTDANAAGLMCPDKVTIGLQLYLTKVDRDYSVHTLFDFSHNALSATIAHDGFATIEEEAQKGSAEELPLHAGPVTQRSLVVLEKDGGNSLSWKQYRVGMLIWLESHGFDGMKKLMFATMKDLMTSR